MSITKDASVELLQNGFNAFVTNTMLFVASVVVRGFVISQLWNWFVASALGAATIGIGEGLGLALTIALFTMGLKREETIKGRVMGIFGNVMLLGVGVLYHYVLGIG